ncbi:cell division protein FtsW [Aeromicrobium marinum DSM 15272]|uniref:Probable peptidoglycan glycosyltransferase FtsW n=1 Tax=Aeromicrobium marinum DSM 15272 TaxID=585531 RepID=E2S965_9ACTN|nr:putative lipid II flippase FtsW [Aeromicrobium marinum]EFQ84335.1 cell division protein FtsW [Aeromicrobium marinum DSM 15272]
MTTAAERRPALVEAARRTLDRPLASYQLVLGTGALLVGLGLVMVLSASSVLAYRTYDNSYAIVMRQGLFATLGLVGAVVAAKMPLHVVKRLSGLALVGVVALIGLTLVPGIGVEVGGNRNWLPLPGGFQLQPSEFAKLALVIWIATIYAGRQKRLRSKRSTRAMMLPVVPIAGGVALLIVAQKDLGTALVLFSILAGLLWSVGLPGRHLAAVFTALGVGLVFFVATAPHRVSRMLSFLNPMADPEQAGYQSIHSMMALATGGFWGVGLGGSRQKWGSLPNAHTDFVMSVVGEELGLFGSFVVLALFVLLAVAGIRIAMRTTDPFAHYVAIGITIWLSVQAIINIGMVLGLLPVIGIPLPFMSYGGSSLLVTMVALGLLANCALTEPGARRALAAGRRPRRR